MERPASCRSSAAPRPQPSPVPKTGGNNVRRPTRLSSPLARNVILSGHVVSHWRGSDRRSPAPGAKRHLGDPEADEEVAQSLLVCHVSLIPAPADQTDDQVRMPFPN